MRLFFIPTIYQFYFIFQTRLPQKQIRFVDYGNVEICPVDDLLAPNSRICRIPIQTRKYCLANLRPVQTDANGRWSRTTLDFLHSHIVDQVANVSIVCESDTDEVTPCRIVVNGINIHDLLLEQDLAINNDAPQRGNIIAMTKTPNTVNRCSNTASAAAAKKKKKKKKSNVPATVDGLSNKQNAEIVRNMAKDQRSEDSHHSTYFEDGQQSSKNSSQLSFTKAVTSSVRERAMNYDQYKALFAAIERPMMQSVQNTSLDEDPEEEYCANTSIIESAFTDGDESDPDVTIDAVPITHFDPNNDELSDSSIFDPFGVSTPISSVSSGSIKHWSLQQPFTNFKMMRLKQTTYDASPVLILNSLHMWIQPENTHYDPIFAKMNKFLNQENAQPPPAAPVDLIQPGFLCVVIFKEDLLYYRAMVRSYDGVLDEVQIVYIDFLNMETITASEVRVCPPKIAKIPLQNVFVRIHGVKRNSRWTEAKVVHRLGQAMKGATLPLQVTVVKPADGDNLAEVVLHDNQELVYRDMIAERYYDEIK